MRELSADLDIISMGPPQARSRFDWTLDLSILSRWYHPTGPEAEDEIAQIAQTIYETLAADPKLATADTPPDGLLWCRVAGIELDPAQPPEGAAGQQAGKNQWQAQGTVTVSLATRAILTP